MLNSLPKHSGIYFVRDNINSLQFKIHFRSINTLLNLPKCTVPECINKESIARGGQIENSLPTEEKTVLIKWQRKLFSPTECKVYSDLKNCVNDQHRKYHEMLKEQECDKKQTKRKRQRKKVKTEVMATNDNKNLIFTYVHKDNFLPSSDLDENMTGKRECLLEGPFEQMFVYAALSSDIQLAVLRWFKQNHLFYIYPDFTNSQNQPYFIEINSDYRHLYSYGIEDVSLKDLSASIGQEQFIYLPELPTHWRIEEEVANKFAMPPRRTQRFAIIIAIRDVAGFEYDNVHVRYHIKLPENTILEEGLLNAASHTSTSSPTNSPIHIGFSWQITILCEEQFDPSQHLRIFFEIISIDSWERERIEGFSQYSLNLLQAGQHTVEIKCIRPVETILESIKRYFIGGRRKFNYESFVYKQADKSMEGASNIYCRYGERMQNSGRLNLSCHILSQRSCELLNPCPSRTTGMTLDDIMMAYKEARKRLEAITLN